MTTTLEGGERSASRPGRSLVPGKTRYPLYRRLGGPKGRFGQVRKISPLTGFDPRTVQSVASRYTDYSTRSSLYENAQNEKFAILRLCLKNIGNRSVGFQKLRRAADNYVTSLHGASYCTVWCQHKRWARSSNKCNRKVLCMFVILARVRTSVCFNLTEMETCCLYQYITFISDVLKFTHTHTHMYIYNLRWHCPVVYWYTQIKFVKIDIFIWNIFRYGTDATKENGQYCRISCDRLLS